MDEKNARVCRERTAVLDSILERGLMSAEPRPDRRKDLFAPEPQKRPGKKSDDNAQNDPYHRSSPISFVRRIDSKGYVVSTMHSMLLSAHSKALPHRSQMFLSLRV